MRHQTIVQRCAWASPTALLQAGSDGPAMTSHARRATEASGDEVSERIGMGRPAFLLGA